MCVYACACVSIVQWLEHQPGNQGLMCCFLHKKLFQMLNGDFSDLLSTLKAEYLVVTREESVLTILYWVKIQDETLGIHTFTYEATSPAPGIFACTDL